MPRSARSAKPRGLWRSVAIPAEHGGWGLTLEPALLGILVAPSASGLALGASAVVAFVARTPLRLMLVDRHRDRALDRTAAASRILLGEAVLLAILLIIATATARGPFWLPLVAAGPLIAVELYYDMRSRSRRLLPELAGAFGIGSVGASIALAGAAPWQVALGAWIVVVARATASIPFVRHQLARAKHPAASMSWPSDLFQLFAITIVALGAALGWVSVAALAAVALLAATQLVLSRLHPPVAAVIGVQQVLLGLLVAIVAGLTM